MTLFASLPNDVRLMEVGPRDGLQNEKTVVETRHKIAFIHELVAAGCKRVEVTGFVNPRWIPPLADHAEVARGIQKQPDVVYAALVPNMKGYEGAVAAGLTEVSIVLSASDTHNRKNINAGTDEALGRYVEVAERARADRVRLRAYVSCAMGCPYEGDLPVATVVSVAERLLALGAYELSIGDTIGTGTPKQTALLVRALRSAVPIEQVALHLHDTRGTALANIVAALEEGVRSFDSSAGGLGGCPYAPGASGNVATEDLVYMLHGMGIHTGIDLEKLVATSAKLEKLLGRPLPSKVLGAMRGTCAVA